jgi:hypothetical protein
VSKDPVLKIAIGKPLALQCQQVLQQQGVPLNVTQAVSAMLTFAIQTKTKDGAAQTAYGVSDEQQQPRR